MLLVDILKLVKFRLIYSFGRMWWPLKGLVLWRTFGLGFASDVELWKMHSPYSPFCMTPEMFDGLLGCVG